MLRVDHVHVVRHKVLVEGRSQRQVARELGIARETVRKYLTESIPVRKETQPRARPVWDTVRRRVEQVLTVSAQWTGGKQRLGRISRQGDQYIRRLLIIGAQTTLLRSKAARANPWIQSLLARCPRLKVAVALANKTARIAWALMAKGESYRPMASA